MDQRRLGKVWASFAGLVLLAHPAHAGLQNDIPSCYAANQITPVTPAGYSRLIYVLIDQTVGWTSDLEQSILDNLNSNLVPGTKFVVAQFSAFSQGRYLNVIHTGIIEEQMAQAQINSTPIEKTKIFDACLRGQLAFAVRLADSSVDSALQGSTSSLDHSDIMSALKSVSTALAADPAPRKMLFLASDGLENSGLTSFYHRGSLKQIDPEYELQRAAAAGLIGDFGKSEIVVIGGALSGSKDDPTTYRSPTALEALEKFWRIYFAKSNGNLVQFGEPALLQPVGF